MFAARQRIVQPLTRPKNNMECGRYERYRTQCRRDARDKFKGAQALQERQQTRQGGVCSSFQRPVVVNACYFRSRNAGVAHRRSTMRCNTTDGNILDRRHNNNQRHYAPPTVRQWRWGRCHYCSR